MSALDFIQDDDTPADPDNTGRLEAVVMPAVQTHADSVRAMIEAAGDYADACAETDYRVLVVDDDEGFLDALGAALERRGYEVDLAPNAMAGRTLTRIRHYDAAIIDVLLVGTSGVELVKQLRREQTRRLPIVLISGEVEGELTTLAADCDADAILTKPMSDETMASTISGLIKLHRAQAAV